MKEDLNDKQIMATIFDKLARRGCWSSMKYRPKESLISWISARVKKDGKRIKRIFEKLIREGFLKTKKSGKVVWLNKNKWREIMELRKKVFGE